MASEGSIPAIVLAAGFSSRMEGRFKPLLPIGRHPLIYHVVNSLSRVSGIGPIILVTGHRAEEVGRAAAGEPDLRLVFNPDYEAGGMVSSVQCGVRSVPVDAPEFLLSLGDQPAILPETIAQLVGAWKAGRSVIAIPTYSGKRGHPIIVSASCIPEILDLKVPETMKTVVERHAKQVVEVRVMDRGVIVDIDTPKDYESILQSWRVR